jgi:hypothetical protein
MPVTGAWLRTQFQLEPNQAEVHQFGPDHAVKTEADATLGGWQGPPILETDEAPYLVGESVPYVVDTPGLILDHSPSGHEFGYGGRNFTEWPTEPYDAGAPADIAMAANSAAMHSEDFGSAHKGLYDNGPMSYYDEHYGLTRIEGYGPMEIVALAGGGQRGLNSYAVNNPPDASYGGHGYRYGETETPWMSRRMYWPERVNDERLATVDTMSVTPDQPVPGDPGQYNSPFGSYARALTDIAQKPFMRRQPPPVDQSLLTDGSEYVYDASGDSDDWVIG